MKTINKSLVIEAALAALCAAAFAAPAAAQDAATKGDGSSDKPMPVKKAHSKKSGDKVHCYGVNSCKGKSACSVDGKSSCQGKNACKGQGWISLTAKKCAAKKGTVVGDAAAPTNPAPTPAPASTPAAK